jgi:hypothetical protein
VSISLKIPVKGKVLISPKGERRQKLRGAREAVQYIDSPDEETSFNLFALCTFVVWIVEYEIRCCCKGEASAAQR